MQIFKRLLGGSDSQVSGSFDFHLEFGPRAPVVTDTIVLEAFFTPSKERRLPVSVRWFKVRNNASQELKTKSLSLLCDPEFVRFALRAQLTSLQPTCPGTALIDFPVVTLEAGLRRSLRKALSGQRVELQAFISSNCKEKEVVVQLQPKSVRVSCREKRVQFSFLYSLIAPLLLFREGENRSIWVRFDRWNDALSSFVSKLFAEERLATVEGDQLCLRFPSNLCRDIFYFGLKAFATRAELVNSFTLHALQFDHIDEAKYDLLLEIGQLNKQLLFQRSSVQNLESRVSKLSEQHQSLLSKTSRRLEDESQLKSRCQSLESQKAKLLQIVHSQQEKARSWQQKSMLSISQSVKLQPLSTSCQRQREQLDRRLQAYQLSANQIKHQGHGDRQLQESDLKLLISCISDKKSTKHDTSIRDTRMVLAPPPPSLTGNHSLDSLACYENRVDDLTRRNDQLMADNKELTRQLRELRASVSERKTQASQSELHKKLEQLQRAGRQKDKTIAGLTQRLRSVSSMLDVSTSSLNASTTGRDSKLKGRVESLLLQVELLRKEKDLLAQGKQEQVSALEQQIEFYQGQYERSAEERRSLLGENERLKKELERARRELRAAE